MEFSGEGVSVYAEAKGEYTRQLCQYLAPSLQKYFLDLLELAKEREKDTKKHLLCFQTLLENISEWNIDKVQRETQTVAINTHCDYLEELLTAVFIAHTKVLSAIRLTNKQKKLQITIPKLEHFLHRTLVECARLLWKDTYLFASNGSSMERQKNMRQIESLITEGILQGVRTMLPVKSILREYLATDDSDSDDDAEADAEEADEEADAEEEEKEPPVEEAPSRTKLEPTGPAQPQPEPVSEPEERAVPPILDFSALTGPSAPVTFPAGPLGGRSAPTTPILKSLSVPDEPPALPAIEESLLPGPKASMSRPSTPVPLPAPVKEEFNVIEEDDIPLTEFEEIKGDDGSDEIEFEEL